MMLYVNHPQDSIANNKPENIHTHYMASTDNPSHVPVRLVVWQIWGSGLGRSQTDDYRLIHQ